MGKQLMHEAGRAAQAERNDELRQARRLGHADARRGSGQAAFGGADVRPVAHHVGRQAGRQRGRHQQRLAGGCQRGSPVRRKAAGQDADGMHQPRLLALQFGQARFGQFAFGARLGHVRGGTQAMADGAQGQLFGTNQRGDVVAGDIGTRLRAAQGGVVGRQFSQQAEAQGCLLYTSPSPRDS